MEQHEGNRTEIFRTTWIRENRITIVISTSYLGIEFYLFVSHGGMKRQRVHV